MGLTEAERWRRKALKAVEDAGSYLAVLVWSTSRLVSLAQSHQADSFGHCTVCKTPWPCETASTVREIAERFVQITE